MTSSTEKLNVAGAATSNRAPISIAGMRAGEIDAGADRRARSRTSSAPFRPAVDGCARRCARRLPSKHGAEVTCPVTIGYHLRTVAEAAHEALERGTTLDRDHAVLARARRQDADHRTAVLRRGLRRRAAQTRKACTTEACAAPTGCSRSSSICAAAAWSPPRSSAHGSRSPSARSTATSPTCSRPACRSMARPASAT